jgi:TIR domain
MTGSNPYNSTKPGNLFVGYERLRSQLLNGFRNGNSFAVLGGRRCGKTSLLMQLKQDLQAHDLAPFRALPRFLDVQGLDHVTPALLFETIYRLVLQEVEASPWVPDESGRDYENFLAHLDAAKPVLDRHYGSNWLVILLIDELDAAISKLPDDQFFQNLRNFSMVSRFHSHFRLVASGVREMSNLISSGSSPLNYLRNSHLRILTGGEARQLITFGFPAGFEPEIESFLFQLTGRHPYVLQGVLENLWDDQGELDKSTLRRAAREFLNQHRNFFRWLDAFGQAEHAVYRLLSETPDGTLHVRDIRHRLDPSLTPDIEEALTVLSYHGLIDDNEPDEPQIAATLFRDWYRDNRPGRHDSAEARPAPLRLFYSYSHKDEAMREVLDTHLALLKREGVIADWHDRKIIAGQEWKGRIDRNLDEADIILLLVSANFLASDYCYEIEMQRALARHQAGEACVIPVIIRAVDWSSAPFAGLQALPKDARPVARWPDRDAAWTDVARGLRRTAEELRKRRAPSQTPGEAL